MRYYEAFREVIESAVEEQVHKQIQELDTRYVTRIKMVRMTEPNVALIMLLAGVLLEKGMLSSDDIETAFSEERIQEQIQAQRRAALAQEREAE